MKYKALKITDPKNSTEMESSVKFIDSDKSW